MVVETPQVGESVTDAPDLLATTTSTIDLERLTSRIVRHNVPKDLPLMTCPADSFETPSSDIQADPYIRDSAIDQED